MGTPQPVIKKTGRKVDSDWEHPSHKEDRWKVIGDTPVIKKTGGK